MVAENIRLVPLEVRAGASDVAEVVVDSKRAAAVVQAERHAEERVGELEVNNASLLVLEKVNVAVAQEVSVEGTACDPLVKEPDAGSQRSRKVAPCLTLDGLRAPRNFCKDSRQDPRGMTPTYTALSICPGLPWYQLPLPDACDGSWPVPGSRSHSDAKVLHRGDGSGGAARDLEGIIRQVRPL